MNKMFWIISFICVLFYAAVISDFIPLVRGPVDKSVSVQWTYYFVNTVSKIWAPVVVFIGYILLFIWIWGKKKWKVKEELISISLIVFIIFIFQLSLVYFSRFGLTVLFRRVVDPGINGYFTASLKVKDVESFLRNYPKEVLYYPQHAASHPPGSPLFLYGIENLFKSNPALTQLFIKFIREPKGEALRLWKGLSDSGRVSAIFAAFLLHFLSSLAVLPLYYMVKLWKGKSAALRTIFIYGFIPSVSFFAVLFDPFYALFSLFSFWLLYFGIKNGKNIFIFASGFILTLGLFFSFSLLPVFLFLLVLDIIFSLRKGKNYIYVGVPFILGGSVVLILLTGAGFNLAATFMSISKNLAPHSSLWFIFNPYEFFIFSGLPVSLLFFWGTIKAVKDKVLHNEKLIYLSFWITFVATIILDINKRETGRTYITLMFIPVALTGSFITDKLKLSNKAYIWILFLLFMQVLVMEEYWVPVW